MEIDSKINKGRNLRSVVIRCVVTFLIVILGLAFALGVGLLFNRIEFEQGTTNQFIQNLFWAFLIPFLVVVWRKSNLSNYENFKIVGTALLLNVLILISMPRLVTGIAFCLFFLTFFSLGKIVPIILKKKRAVVMTLTILILLSICQIYVKSRGEMSSGNSQSELIEVPKFDETEPYEVVSDEELKDYENKFRVMEIFGRRSIIIEGEIELGDYLRFLKLVKKEGPETSKVFLMSPGGDVREALKIGRLIRRLRYETESPAIEVRGNNHCQPKPIKNQNCTCDSACFLIFVSGTYRFAKMLGIHRAYLNHQALKNLSGSQAVEANNVIKNEVENYLKSMGVQNELIERMFSLSSREIEYLTEKELDRYFKGDIPEFSEWLIAKCKKEAVHRDYIWHLMEKRSEGRATKEEIALLDDPDFTFKEAGCMSAARQRLIEEVWDKEIKRAFREEKIE